MYLFANYYFEVSMLRKGGRKSGWHLLGMVQSLLSLLVGTVEMEDTAALEFGKDLESK